MLPQLKALSLPMVLRNPHLPPAVNRVEVIAGSEILALPLKSPMKIEA